MQCTEDTSNQNKSELETEEKVSTSLNCKATIESDKIDQESNLSLYFDNSNYLLFDNVLEDKKAIEDYLVSVRDSNKQKVELKDLKSPEIESYDEVIDSKNIYASSKVYVPKLSTKQEMSLLGKCSGEVVTESLNQRILIDKSEPIDLNYDVSNASCTLENEISYEPFAIGYTGLNPVRKSIASSLQELSLNHETSLASANHHSAKNSSKKLNFSKSKLKVGHLSKTLTKSQKSTTFSLGRKNKTPKIESSSTTSCSLLDKNILERGKIITNEGFEEPNCDDSVYKANKNIGKGNKKPQKAGQNKARVKLKYSADNEIKTGKQLRVRLTDFFANKSMEDYINLYKHKTSICSNSATDSKNTVALSNFKDEVNDNTTLQDNHKETKNKKQTKITCNSVFSNKNMRNKEKDSNQSACLSNPVISNVQQISLKEFNSTSNTENSSVNKISLLGSEIKNTKAENSLSKSLVSVGGINCVTNKSENSCKNHEVEKSKSMTTTPLSKKSPFMQLVSKFVDNKSENSQVKVFSARPDFINFLSNSSKKHPNVPSKEKNCNDQVTPSPKRGKKRKMDKLTLTVNGNDPCCSKSMNLKNIQLQNSESADEHHVKKFISTAEIHVPPKSSNISRSSLSPFRKPQRIAKDATQNSLKSILDEHLLPVSLASQSFSNGEKISVNSGADENNEKEKEDMNSSEIIETDASCSRESKSKKKNKLNKNTKCNGSRMPVKSSKSQHYVTNNRHASVDGLELFQQSQDDISFKSPLKMSNLLSCEASSIKNIFGDMDCSIKSEMDDNVGISSHGVSSTRFETAINRNAMSDVDATLNAFDTESPYSSIPESSEDNFLRTKEQSKQGRKKKLEAKNQLAEAPVLHSPCSLVSNSKKKPIKTKHGKDHHSDASTFDTESFYSNISEYPENFSPVKEKSKQTRKKNSLDKNCQPGAPILFASFSHRLRGKRRSMETKLAEDYSSDVVVDSVDAVSFVKASKSPGEILPVQEKSTRGRKNKLLAVNQLPETSILDSESFLNASEEIPPVQEKSKRGRKNKLLAVNQLPETSILDSEGLDAESFLNASEEIPPVQEKSKRGRKKKLPAGNQFHETSVLDSEVFDAGSVLNTSEYRKIPPVQEKSKRGKKKKSTTNHFSETPVLDSEAFDADSFLNASDYPQDITPLLEKSKRGRKKKLPAVNQLTETSILDSPYPKLSGKEMNSDEMLGESLQRKGRKIKVEYSSNISNLVSDSTKLLNNSYFKTAGIKESKKEKNTKYIARKCIKIKDIINSPENNVAKSGNSSYLKNNCSQSKSLKDLSKNNESRSNVSTKRFENSGCDLIGSVKIKKEISSPSKTAVSSDSSEIDDFFVNSDSAWPTQGAKILSDVKPKVSKRSTKLLKQKTNSVKFTKFLTDDSSENLRKTSEYSGHAADSPRKSVRIKKRTARYSLDAFPSPGNEKSKLESLGSAEKNIKIEPSLEKGNKSKLKPLNTNVSINSASLNTQTTTVATVNSSCYPNQNLIINNTASNGCMSYAVPAYIFPSSNTLVISLPPSFSFNSNQVNSSNQFMGPLQASQVPTYNPSNIITQFNSPSTSRGVSYPLFQGTPLSQPSTIQGNNLFSPNITAQTGFQRAPDTMVSTSQGVSYPLFQGTPLSQPSTIQGNNLFSPNITAQTGFQRAPDTMVVNSDMKSKRQFLSPGNFNIIRSTPVMNVQNISSYNSPKLNSTPSKGTVKRVNRIVEESTAIENTISLSVNSRQKQNSSSTVSQVCQNQPSKRAAGHSHQNKQEHLVNNQQNERAVVKDIVNGLVLWDKVMHNLTGFTCLQRMTEFTAAVFSACDFDEFVTVQEYFCNKANLKMLNLKLIDHSFETSCQVMYQFPEQLFNAPMRQVLKDYVSNHVKHVLTVTNHEELIEQVYQKFSLKDCLYLSAIVPKEDAKKQISLKILVEYFTFVAVLRIYDEYKKRVVFR